ncbi:hypothetical protein NEUTE2DRAFT_80334 [Neurospora tetrasperma FGSC 2509]|nr:hypothetical protein NEUTE2DRAFT_80334 [Neurospora tetrasperma FGSC 2509]
MSRKISNVQGTSERPCSSANGEDRTASYWPSVNTRLGWRKCRTRKVKCTHFDDTELEANYQASKQTQHEPFVNEKIGKASETDCWALHRLSDPTLTVSTAAAMPAP